MNSYASNKRALVNSIRRLLKLPLIHNEPTVLIFGKDTYTPPPKDTPQ